MEQYIKKSDIVAEIKNWIKEASRRYTLSKVQFSLSDRIKSLENLLSFLDTLEVKEIKEVDVENTAITEWDDYIKKIDGEPNYAYMLVKREDYISLAKHFYELGQISTRKED